MPVYVNMATKERQNPIEITEIKILQTSKGRIKMAKDPIVI